jgi:diguanylate cyclase (GGDEF)-like protein/PAS domain S-box-containing protein
MTLLTSRQRVNALGGGLLLLVLGWLGALGFVSWSLRGETLNNGLATAALHARNFEEHLTQTLQTVEHHANSVEAPGNDPALHQALNQQLLGLLRPTPHLRSLSVLDASGRVVASSNTNNLGIQLDMSGFFPAAPPSAEVVRVGTPTAGRDLSTAALPGSRLALQPDTQYFVPLLSPLVTDQTHHRHWLLATLNPDYFINHATQVLPAAQGWIQWLRYDDVLLASSSANDPPSRQGTSGRVSELLPQDEHHAFFQRLPQGTDVLTAYRASTRYPVVVVTHLDREAVLAGWRQQATRLAAIVLPILGALLGFGYLFWQRQRRLAAQQEVLDGQRRLAASVFDSSTDAIVITDHQANILSVNAAFEHITGFSAAQVVGRNPSLLGSGQQDRAFYEAMWATLMQAGHWAGVVVNRRRQGHLYTAMLRINAVRDADGQLQHYTGLIQDVTDKHRDEERLHLAASVFTHALEGIMITTPSGQVLEVNDAFSRITGYSRTDITGQHTRLLSSGRQGKEFYAQMWQSLTEQGRWSGEIWNRRKSGEVYAEMLTISAVRNTAGEVMRYVALFSDISKQKEHEHRLEHIAHYDALTGLPNRVLLADRLRQSMAQTVRRNRQLGLVFLDLDGFKAINDEHGHDMGDQLLMALASRMQQALRDGDTLARLGGDEFVAVLGDLADPETAAPVLERLRTAAAQPVLIDGRTLQVSASLGVAFYPQRTEMDAEQLLRQADQAMYQAKVAGKNRCHVFDDEQDRSIRGHHESLEAIRQGLKAQAFELYYQPKVNMRTGALVGAEALIRWHHPERGLLLPGEFLPLLHHSELSIELGEWVLDAAMAQVVRWKALGLQVPVSVNIDAQHLQRPNFVSRLKALLAVHPQVGPGDLELEILETSALDDIGLVSQLMNDCRDIGVGFALDDFGTGYSSLTYLRRLPAALLKIDQSFVRDLLDDPEDMAILEGVLGLARAFRMQAIAEGVETAEHGAFLLRLGCDWGQGYAIARPMPGSALPTWAAQWQPEPGWKHLRVTPREDLPLLTAVVEMRAWVATLEAHLNGLAPAPPELDPTTCEFGLWLHQQGRVRHGSQAGYARVDALHQTIHLQAQAMVNQRAQGQAGEALAHLPALHATRHALTVQLLDLLNQSD